MKENFSKSNKFSTASQNGDGFFGAYNCGRITDTAYAVSFVFCALIISLALLVLSLYGILISIIIISIIILSIIIILRKVFKGQRFIRTHI